MTSDTEPIHLRPLEKALSLAVPVASFGGLGLAIVLEQAGVIADAGMFNFGCIVGGFLLGYLAFIKPRKDIVALCAPLYTLFLFVIPIEVAQTVLLQLLFAVSVTILVVRLNLRFSAPVRKKEGIAPMEQYLYDYIERIRPHYQSIDSRTAHEIASTILSYKFGLYGKAVEESNHALALLSGSGAIDTLKKALLLVNTRAKNLENADYSPVTSIEFTDADQIYIAMDLPADQTEDRATYQLDNALLLIYATAYVSSPDDEATLEEQQNIAINILESYKTALLMK